MTAIRLADVWIPGDAPWPDRMRTPAQRGRGAGRVRGTVPLLSLVALLAAACNPPHPPAEGIGCSVGVVGDSLVVGAAPHLPGDLADVGCTHVFTDAREGRLTHRGAEALTAAELSGVDLLVVGLGTNDWEDHELFGRRIDLVMAAAEGRRVVWLNVGGSIDTKDSLNLALWGATQRWDDLWVLDWNLVVEQRPDLVGRDGIHLTPEGYALRSAVIAEFIASGQVTAS